MGLIQNLPIKGGGTTGYINVQGHRRAWYDGAKQAVINLGLYKDREAREAGEAAYPAAVAADLTDEEIGLYRRVDYEVLKRIGTIYGVDISDAGNHHAVDDPNIAGLVATLTDWEVKALSARVAVEMEARELEPLAQAEIDAYFPPDPDEPALPPDEDTSPVA